MESYIPKQVDKESWRKALRPLPTHRKRELEDFLQQYEEGINFGLDEIPTPVHSKANPKMDEQSRIKMGQTILKWHKKGYLLGPYPATHPIANECRINPVFCVPKPDGSVRPVVNYSKSIQGDSLNDLIDPEWCTVEYIQLREIVYTVKSVGRGAMIWAKDLQDGYFNIRIHPEMIKSIAFVFAGLLFIPMVMVFGLSSAPLIFTMFMWYAVMAIKYANPSIMRMEIPKSKFHREYFQQEADIQILNNSVSIPLVMYYLDDIFGVQTPELVYQQYESAGITLKQLGLSAKAAKDKPPNTTQTLLGIEYDTIKQEVRVPLDKVQKYTEYAQSLINSKQITKRQLFSLTGKVRWAAMQCKPLSAFARGIEIHGHKPSLKWHHHINMTHRLKRDIRLVMDGLAILRSRGTSFDFILQPRNSCDMVAFTDAAGKEGIGGFVKIQNAPYFQVRWNEVMIDTEYDIHWKEMVAIAVLFECNAYLFKNKRICIWADNKPVIDMLIKWRAKIARPDLQHLLRRIAHICIQYNITPWWEHIEGKKNKTADRLSRFHPRPFCFESVTPARKPSTSARQALQCEC